jgi:hypothetical protein
MSELITDECKIEIPRFVTFLQQEIESLNNHNSGRSLCLYQVKSIGSCFLV